VAAAGPDSLAAMHRSRLIGILIDTPAAQAGAAVDFWSAALGVPARPARGEEQFTVLRGAVPGLLTVVQAVGDAPRYHLDIETDDLTAEVARLTALGAEPVARWQDAHTLRAPGGHLLCVVPVHSDPETFASSARTWP
jgi:Glyoxalase-like domain